MIQGDFNLESIEGIADWDLKHKLLEKHDLWDLNQPDKKSFISKFNNDILVKKYVERITWNRSFSKLKLDQYDLFLTEINTPV